MNSCRYTDDYLIRQIKELSKELNKTPSLNDFRKAKNTASPSTIINHFGSWNNFIKAANLPLTNKRKNNTNYKTITEKQLIEQIQILAEEIHKVPSLLEFKKCKYTSSIKTVLKHFDSWSDFLKSAQLFRSVY